MVNIKTTVIDKKIKLLSNINLDFNAYSLSAKTMSTCKNVI